MTQSNFLQNNFDVNTLAVNCVNESQLKCVITTSHLLVKIIMHDPSSNYLFKLFEPRKGLLILYAFFSYRLILSKTALIILDALRTFHDPAGIFCS